jgi:RNA polymerase sigma factor (sigma-70 family)
MFLHSNINSIPANVFEAFRNGDQVAFKYFYDRYSKALYQRILAIVKDSEEADDIIVEAFVLLAKNREKINDPDHLMRYIYIVARNGAIDRWRKSVRRRKAENEIYQLAETVYIESKEDEDFYKLLIDRILCIIQNLSPRQKKILTLVFFTEKSTRSIAKQLDLREQTVRNHLSRAIGTVRKALEQV